METMLKAVTRIGHKVKRVWHLYPGRDLAAYKEGPTRMGMSGTMSTNSRHIFDKLFP
jgi:hypothetical protein